jgi:large subunit ribosomal protein MRP49
MPYQKIPKALRPLYLKGLPASRALKQAHHLDLISNFENSAYKLNTVDKLEVIFKNHSAYGHFGMRQFWKYNLKTVYFHNPDLPIEVKRIECATKEEQLQCPCIIKVHLKDGKVETIEGKDKHSSTIMQQLIDLTDAEKITSEELDLFVPKVSA